MMCRVRFLAWCTVALVALFSAQAVGDGMILPDDPARGQLSIVYHDVEVTAHDGLVTHARRSSLPQSELL
jgi:hypothetical protein